jgi:predicted NAD-dependent protein-ADP-ribosyltransferase YbiA (DUF1768 family)
MGLDVIGEFAGEWEPLAGQAHTPFTLDKVDYPTLWHAIFIHKTRIAGQKAFIAMALTGFEAERRARGVQPRPGWHTRIWRDVATRGLAAKFDPAKHPKRATLLRSTGNAELVDGNRVHRKHWGRCFCGRLACAGGGGGENHLGLLLMDLRTRLAGHPE